MLEQILISLDAYEVELVARVVAHAEEKRLTRIARTATRLGNGALYPVLALFVLLSYRVEAPVRFLFAAALSLAIAFAIYPLLKTSIARARPCDYDPSLARLPEPLDHYSCPSGHAMTAAAFAVPMIFALPAATPVAIAVCGIVSWSRVALGHHYVSDVILGTILGGVVATGVGAALY